jgi:riboflavin biosynthesis pyrimidine reductase
VVGPRNGPVDSADLAELTEIYDWPDRRRWVRAMMVSTLDGATMGADHRSRSISSVEDRAVFDATRRHSDVVLIGAGTFRAERYRPLRVPTELAQQRRDLGLAPAPVVAIVSRSLDLPWDEPIFAESDIRPVVVTGSAAEPERLRAAKQHAQVLELPSPGVDLGEMFDRFEALGLLRIVCEGGARLLSTVVRSGLLDEVDLSISPLMTAGGQVATGVPLAVPPRFALAHVMVGDDGFLFTRFIRRAR